MQLAVMRDLSPNSLLDSVWRSISCYVKPMERTSDIMYHLVSLVCSTGFLWQLIGLPDWVRMWNGAFGECTPMRLHVCNQLSDQTLCVCVCSHFLVAVMCGCFITWYFPTSYKQTNGMHSFMFKEVHGVISVCLQLWVCVVWFHFAYNFDGWGTYGLFQACRYHLELNFVCVQLWFQSAYNLEHV